MDVQSVSAILFLVFLAFFLFIERKKVKLQKIFFPILYLLMYKSKFGINQMEKVAGKYPRLLRVLGLVGIAVGFLGMVVLAASLVDNLVKLFTTPSAMPGVQLVIPIKTKFTFYVPFFYWLLSIVIIAIVHEFSHGVIARAYGMKIKSSGFAFLGVIIPILPAAFVEPDEREMARRPLKQRLSVFAAGPFSNILFGFFVAVILLMVLTPVNNFMFQNNGVGVVNLVAGKEFGAQKAGIAPGERITSIDGILTSDIEVLRGVLASKKPGDRIEVMTNRLSYNVTLSQNPTNASQAYLGVYLEQSRKLRPEIKQNFGDFVPGAVIWFFELLYWLYFLSIGIGLVNLLPLGIVDGGRMTLALLNKYCKKKRAISIWKVMSTFFLLLILANILFALFK